MPRCPAVSPARRSPARLSLTRLGGAALMLWPALAIGEPRRPPTPAPRSASAQEVRAAIARSGARVTLVNVWATWCQPCREEFPALVRVAAALRDSGVRVVYVSADFPERRAAARRFLAAQGVRDSTWLKRDDDQAFIRGLSERWSGALPATFVFDERGALLEFWEGKADEDRFIRAARAALEKSNSGGDTP